MKKIYVKLNGTFQEYEDTPQIRQGLHIDKQIAEQAGKEFQIFEPEQLSDEDALSLGVATEPELLEKYRKQKFNEISSSFNSELMQGHFFSETLQIEVDCRRSGMKNDLQNVQGLISYLERNEKTETIYVGYSESKTVSVQMLKNLCTEMEDHVLALYHKKWQLEELTKAAKSRAELGNIVW